jgi:formiminotetrahydrofolate cyclodeaminase
LDELRKTTNQLTQAIDLDAASYDEVVAAFKLPQANEDEIRQRDSAVETATKKAAEVPLAVAEKGAQLNKKLLQLEMIAAASMKSDLQVARLMAVAGTQGALANVEINLEGLKDTSYVQRMRERVAEVRKQLS